MKSYKSPKLHEDWIDPQALKVVQKLQQAGFLAYLVGGCVRDLLVGIHPKDFDIVTSATPEQVKHLIRGSYIIGRRFKLVLLKRFGNQYEISTFRRMASADELEDENTPGEENFFGSPEEDAGRRDFTVNGLFYDPVKNEIIDYINGQRDIEAGLIRMIGDPAQRISEDPIRILRAIRLSHKLGFSLEENLRRAVSENGKELVRAVLPRKREEYLKILRLSNPALALTELYDLGLTPHLFPQFDKILSHPEHREIVQGYLDQTSSLVLDPNQAQELILPLVLSFLEINQIKTIEDFEKFDFTFLETNLRDEVGVFKAEIGSLFNILETYFALTDWPSFERKGQRRQLSFLTRDSFPVALNMAEKNNLLSPEHLTNWKTSFLKSQAPGI